MIDDLSIDHRYIDESMIDCHIIDHRYPDLVPPPVIIPTLNAS